MGADGADGLRDMLKAATESTSTAESDEILRNIALGDRPNDAESLKVKEDAIQRLTDSKVKQKDAEALRKLLADLRQLFGKLPKAKTAKIVRNLIDAIAKVPDSTQLQLEVCKEQVEWARTEKRTFLRQRIEARLANLYLQTKEFSDALTLISRLLTEVKRLDDKLLLVDIHLLESRVHLALRNQPKSKAALTAARTAANSIYVPPSIQAEIDMQSGTLHADEKDYKTSFSYFYEAFEAMNALDDTKASLALKYMLLTKIMVADLGEVSSIIAKNTLKYAGSDVDAMKAVAKAYKDRSIEEFQKALSSYKKELQEDSVILVHLSRLYNTLLEQNLCRLIEPYSRVEIDHLAKLIKLPTDDVLAKLSQMILDKKFSGTLDQGSGCLEVFEDEQKSEVYPSALSTFDSMSKVVDTLFLRSQKYIS